MSSTCWKPDSAAAPGWGDADQCGPTNQWTPGAYSDSRACVAVACLVVACSPEPAPDWVVATGGDYPVCGVTPGAPVGRAFSGGFSGGFS